MNLRELKRWNAEGHYLVQFFDGAIVQCKNTNKRNAA